MDHTDTGLRAVVKTLRDVIAPAVSSADPLAQEQLRLSIDYLEFLRGRFEFLHDRERFELRHHLGLARALLGLAAPVSSATATAMSASIDAGDRTAIDAAATTRALKAATAALAAAVAATVRDAAGMEASVRRAIERCVVTMSDERIAFERAWYLPLGFDPAPGEVRPLPDILGSG
jgi:hypothetical protein